MNTVLVTGANRGLGLEFARQYAADGWRVHAACRDPGAADELRELAARSGGRIAVIALDVSDLASVRAAAQSLAGTPIDLLINNAGVGSPRGQKLGALDYAAWARVLDVNTLGPMRVAESFLEHLAAGREKTIVTITSGMGSIADNASGGSYAYRSSKAAVNMVVRSLSLDLAPRGITCGSSGRIAVISLDVSDLASVRAAAQALAGTPIDLLVNNAGAGKFFNYDGGAYPW